jgi:anti-anti-sigma factor
MHQLRIQPEHVHGRVVLQLTGAIDPLNFPTLAAVLNRLLATAATHIILNCSDVTYISSVELRELLNWAQLARARGGDVKCVGLSPIIEQVIDLVANGDPIECFPSLNEALQAFASPAVAVAG